ncbi:hypothetical protein [Psychrobacter sp. CAL346-MNA-CIBAN-0220]|uniref:hypothetical protein n=1 Tax=Psychrobacter sp. CAL346-MNA-CIBAN-0220 TaxID=3140457 RepID=UPI0033171766
MNKLFLKINAPILLAPKSYFRILPAVLLSLCGFLTLSACQKMPDSETAADTQTATDDQMTPVATSINDHNQNVDDVVVVEQSAEGVTSNAKTITPSPKQAIKGTQITDVRYRSAAGDTLSVVFETSATGVLNAILTLPNKPKMTLSAPEGQGNNPTYRSADGNIELLSHGGGSTIDLMQNDKVTSFEAISAEAEVVTQP